MPDAMKPRAGRYPARGCTTNEATPAENQSSPGRKPLNLGPTMLPWARRYIRAAAGTTVPDYGTSEWTALPDSDPRKVAACVQAAEAWRTYTDPAEIALRLRLEIDAGRREAQRAWDEEARFTPEIATQVHATGQRLLTTPEPYTGAPRPGDYMGGPVQWEPAQPHRTATTRAREQWMTDRLSAPQPLDGAA